MATTKYLRVGRAVKERRIKLGISQEELTKRVCTHGNLEITRGFCQATSNIERGVQSIPNKHIFAFSRALELDWSVLIEAILADKEHSIRNQLQKDVINEMTSKGI